MTQIQFDAGTLLAADDDNLELSYALVPHGERCRSNLGEFEVGTGAFSIPEDLTGMAVTLDHTRERPVAAFSHLEDQDATMLARFRFAKTKEGRAAYADAKDPNGKRRHVSVEARDVVIRAGKAVSGHVFGASLVEKPAFPSATLLAAAADTPDLPAAPEPGGEPVETTTTSTDEFTDENGVVHKRTTTRTEKAETDTDGNTTVTITETQVIEEPGEQPAEPKEAPVGAATVPATLAAAQAPASKAKSEGQTLNASNVFDMLTKVMTGQDGSGEAQTLLAALTDIKISGAGQLPVGGAAVQYAWLGEVFEKKAYQRRYMPLIRQGDIIAIDEKGFTVSTGAEPVQAWNGNKAELPTASGTTAAVTSAFQRWAVANDIAREFYDIPAGRPVIEAYVRLLVNSYSRVTDYWTLGQMITAAGAQVDYDDTDVPTEYSAALAKVIQVIDLVDETDAEPTFVVVAGDVWRSLRYTPKDQIPEYVSFSLRRTEGEADGGVVVLKDKSATLAAGQVLGGGREAAHVNELPGAAPLQIDALDIANGGIDKAVLGYTQFMAEYAEGLVLLGDEPAP